MIKLNNWHVTRHPFDTFLAPECSRPCLCGEATGHPNPRLKDGELVTTSYVVKIDGLVITTQSGSRYKLGSVSPEYRKWLNKHRPNWDENNPITEVQND